ncbi:MAG: hypothetical protein JW910_00370 [Anaerolineae bacterium]|nr:hypothetical protein [Anaerolineae bacterium]
MNYRAEDLFAQPGQIDSIPLDLDSWLADDHARILRRLLPWLVLALVFGLMAPLLSLLLGLGTWHHLVLAGMMGLGLLLYAGAAHYNRRGNIRRSAYLVLLTLTGVSLTNALLFEQMVGAFAMVSLLNTLLASTLISTRSGMLYALCVLVIGSAMLLTDQFGLALLPFTQSALLPPVKVLGDLSAGGVMLGFGVYLVSRSQSSLRRALQQLMQLSGSLNAANRKLRHEFIARRRAEEARIALAVERERIQILSHFVTAAAHEFRNPLAVINTQLFLLRRACADETNINRLDVLQEQAMYLNALIESMLTMTRLDSGIDLDHQPLHFNNLVQEAANRMRSTAEARGITLALDLAPLPEGAGDAEWLHLAMQHVLRNACDYSPPGSTVTISTCLVEHGVRIVVADQGIGMTLEQTEHIFERFYRGDPARTTRGVGLGLPITKAIVGAHGGYITVKSAPGQGSTFSIFLPLEPPPPDAGELFSV